ncbi:MAG TPA: hydroxysqualene dehydroxylase HpnE [Acidobacteriaceae bacterium]|nr:hydroxysqualene dehydroxylase HpnE [Acidobacteriaceae bacterium]
MKVAVVGAGLAGLAAGCALSNAGHSVKLFERRPYVGGRASSYEHPGTDEVIDNCQHVLVGCCTNLIDLYRRSGVAEQIRWYDRISFMEPGGRRSVLSPSPLPAPLHTSLSFLHLEALTLNEKTAVGRGLMSFVRGAPADDRESFAEWLVRHRQPQRAIDRFWRPVLVSALNEEVDKISVKYAAQVFHDSFLASPEAGRMGIPAIPLSDLYGKCADYIRARGGEVLLRTSVDGVAAEGDGTWRVSSGEAEHRADAVVLALSFGAMQRLLPQLPADEVRNDLETKLAHFESSPITGIHLWFDREVTTLDHAVLLDSTIQWMFQKSRIQPQRHADGSYLELVVSASRSLVNMQRQEIIDLAMSELATFFPLVKEAKLEKAAVVKEVHATFSCTPGLDAFRPAAETGWPRIFLAGDWTATGWPATMEGAVRSGYLAAEAATRAAGAEQRFLVPDLAPQGFMRLFG